METFIRWRLAEVVEVVPETPRTKGLVLGPPHISFDQAKAMTRALYRGDPATPEILRHAFAELVEEYIPHR